MVGVIVSLIVTFALSFLLSLHYSKLRLAQDRPGSEPQKINPKRSSRMGGVAIFLGVLIGMLPAKLFCCFKLLLSVLPIFLVAIYEDFFKSVRPSVRLSISFLSGAIFIGLYGEYIRYVGLPIFDSLLRINFFALVFTIFAIAGVVNAFNIIDGLNGLSGGIALIAFIFLGLAALDVGDYELLTFCMFLSFGILGFLLHNYPGGRILLGDNGAYLIGFLVAACSILLVYRNNRVSPWYPLVLVFYPVFETLFSMYRRIVVKRKTPMEADFQHLHSLIYRRYIKENPGTTKTILFGYLLSSAAAYFLRYHTYALLLLCLLYVFIYVLVYIRIVHFRAGWIRKLRLL